MKIIEVCLKREKYPIYLGYPLEEIGQLFIKHECGNKVFIITDENVSRFYSNAVRHSLENAGKKVDICVVKPGEPSKTIKTAYHLIEKCSQFGLDRTDTIIALGGGVVCDLAGFVASIYLRGISLVSIPTTLLAQVDASVGGKNGVNLPWGKNLVGTFHQPSFVVMDISTLKTLPEREISQGMAEVIKCGIIRSKKLFQFLLSTDKKEIKNHFDSIISECITIKKRVVEMDEKDTKGIREILNFGHTIGHAIEINSRKLNHGECVALGMICETFIAVQKGFCRYCLFENIKELVKKFNLPTKTNISSQKVVHSLLFDKKTKGGKLRFVLPVRPGAVKTGVEISTNDIISNWEKWQ